MIDLAYTTAGTETGDPMLLIHGFMSSRLQWEPNLERLGDAHRLVLLELPGHGASPAPLDPAAYGPDAVLPAIEAIRTSLGIERWWVVGHSMGGAVATRYTADHENVTRGVVITNSRALFGVARSSGLPEPLDPDLRRLPFHPVHATRFPEDLQRSMVVVADAMPPHAVSNLGAAAASWASRERLAALEVPALVVNGRWESAFQPHAEHARTAMPSVEVVDLEGGHSINIEQPEAFDAAVLDFISRHD